MEELLNELGFESKKEWLALVSHIDISTSKKLAAFEEWKNEDGTKEGLVKLDTMFEQGITYAADHGPTGETWRIVGISIKENAVCAAGYPPTIARLSDCSNFRHAKIITEDELEFRGRNFPGDSWI